jgi:hypothetical protein
MRKGYVLDAVVSALFWMPISALASVVIGLTPEQTGLNVLATSLNNLFFGAPFGRILNKWRKMLKYN